MLPDDCVYSKLRIQLWDADPDAQNDPDDLIVSVDINPFIDDSYQ